MGLVSASFLGPAGCISQWRWQCCSCQPSVGSWFLQTVLIYGNRKEDNSGNSISKSYSVLSVKTIEAWSTPETGEFGSEKLGRVQGEQCCLYTITASGMEPRSVCPRLHGLRPRPALEKAADSTYPWGWEDCLFGSRAPASPGWVWHGEDFHLLRLSQRCLWSWKLLWMLSIITVHWCDQCVADELTHFQPILWQHFKQLPL